MPSEPGPHPGPARGGGNLNGPVEGSRSPRLQVTVNASPACILVSVLSTRHRLGPGGALAGSRNLNLKVVTCCSIISDT